MDAPDPVSLRGGKGRMGPSCFAVRSLVALRRLDVFVLEEGGVSVVPSFGVGLVEGTLDVRPLENC